MPMVNTFVLKSDFDTAVRLAQKMFPHDPLLLSEQHVVAEAVRRGMASLRAEWNDAEDQANAKENT